MKNKIIKIILLVFMLLALVFGVRYARIRNKENLANKPAVEQIESKSEELKNEEGEPFVETDQSKMPSVNSDNLEDRARSIDIDTSDDSTKQSVSETKKEDKSQLKIALTFDDGPHPDYTPQVLDVLDKYNVKGTFFVLGANVDLYPEIAKRIVDEGHTIANHTYSHPDLSLYGNDDVIWEIEKCQKAIFDATGVEADLYRLPYGSGGARVVRLLRDELGMTSIIWNMDSQDWQTKDTDSIVSTTFEYLLDDGILLMHDTHQATPQALDIIIPKLKEMGYEFVETTEVDFDMRYYAE